MCKEENVNKVYCYCFDKEEQNKAVREVRERYYCKEYEPILNNVNECCYNCKRFSYVKMGFHVDDNDRLSCWKYGKFSAIKGKVIDRTKIKKDVDMVI